MRFQQSELGIVGSKVVSPLTCAVTFVNHKASQSTVLKKLLQLGFDFVGLVNLFGSHEYKTHTRRCIPYHFPATSVFFFSNVGRKGNCTAWTKCIHLIFLIPNQRKERRNHKSDFALRTSSLKYGRQLVGETLASTSAHNDKDILSR